jgi:hypothetical protein
VVPGEDLRMRTAVCDEKYHRFKAALNARIYIIISLIQ